eukprot:TRINITY_DN1894_c0_g1_i4.p1 TRINITY_DN1894_c0_g1~~TRINITY_DN1894_c0_g1_i4.p1  ORF type:complete len:434 (+),score=111.67 TRINITY_DN1894_c0_g1_i4:46-1347(+)
MPRGTTSAAAVLRVLRWEGAARHGRRALGTTPPRPPKPEPEANATPTPGTAAEQLRQQLNLGAMPSRRRADGPTARSPPTPPPPAQDAPRNDGDASASTAQDVPRKDGDASTSTAPVRTLEPGQSAPTQRGPLGQVVYGEEGYVEDAIDRAEKEAHALRKSIIANATGAKIKKWDDPSKDLDQVADDGLPITNIGTGKGPKPVWSYLDASPRGWWPTGDFAVGAPPDKYGNPPPSKNLLTTSPNKVTKKTATSTERSRELTDVWFARMGIMKRTSFAIGRRLTHKERAALQSVKGMLLVVLFFIVCFFFKVSYTEWGRWKIWQARGRLASGDYDWKLNTIIRDLEACQNKRGQEYDNWLLSFWRTMPMPDDFRAELELIWRECIKKGWIKVDADREPFLEQRFEMKYIPPPYLEVDGGYLSSVRQDETWKRKD